MEYYSAIKMNKIMPFAATRIPREVRGQTWIFPDTVSGS